MLRPDLAAMRRRLDAPIVTRFAPSPTGYLHLGHVVNAIYVWGVAAALGGTVVVRLEDHDRIRSRPEFERALLEDVRWLGFLGPVACAAISRQREREQVYQHALARLRAVAHVYACDCSRATIGGERYPGRCRERRLPETAACSLRVELGPGTERTQDPLLGPLEQTPDNQCGDMVVRDRDGHWSYQFAVTVDDLDQGITLVVRGADLVSSTGRQLRLGRLLNGAGVGGGRWPPTYLHHPLILDETGTKLSKSTNATGIRALRDAGVSAGEVIRRAAVAVGLTSGERPVSAGETERFFLDSSLD